MYLILACGSNGQYQLGINSDEDADVLHTVLFADDVAVHGRPTRIAGGGNHTLILFEDGQVYSAGNNEYGQTGVPSDVHKVLEVFTPISGTWKDVACGWEFLVLVDTKGSAWSCGFGPKGELGLGVGVTQSHSLKPIPTPSGTVLDSVRCGVFQTITRTSDGQLYGWGVCRKGQLGIQPKGLNGKPRACIWAPEKLHVPVDSVQRYEMGREATFIEDNQHQIYRLSTEITNLKTPSNKPIDQLETMWSSVHLRYDGNHILSQGNNSHSQLLSDRPSESIRCMATGSEHGLLLTELNHVYAWGWGEHGNCGKQTAQEQDNDDSVTFSKLNLLYSGKDRVVAIAGGCATSWVVIEK